MEKRVEKGFLFMLQHEDIAFVLISDKKDAKQAHEEAVALLKQIKGESQ